MKKLLSLCLMLLFALTLSLTGCCLFYNMEYDSESGFDIGYSELYNDAFAAAYMWDGKEDTTALTVPDEYDGMPVTSLGGYFGRGVPSPLQLTLDDEARRLLCPDAIEWYATDFVSDENICEFFPLSFSLHIGKNVKEINGLALFYFIVARHESNAKSILNYYVPLFTVTCDEENEVFYSEDGKLYYRENGQLVTGIIYGDFNVWEYISQQTDRPAVNFPF